MAFFYLLLSLVYLFCPSFILGPVTAAPEVDNLPQRILEITGAAFTIDTWVDVGTFGTTLFPLDDRALIDTPEMALLCYSAWDKDNDVKRSALFAHMPMVDLPVVWYYPLNYTLGNWKYDMGDNLICELWECDGNPKGGCTPEKPDILPNAKAGDELLGRATLSIGSFQSIGASILNMTVPKEGKGDFGSSAGTVLIECGGCRQLWRDDPNWLSPFSSPGFTFPQPQSDAPKETDVPKTDSAIDPPSVNESLPPLPAIMDALTSGTNDQQSATEKPVEVVVPPVEPKVPPAPELDVQEMTGPSSGVDTATATDEAKPDTAPEANNNADTQVIAQDPVQELQKEVQNKTSSNTVTSVLSKKSTKTTLIIVLSVLGGMLAVLLLTGLVYFIWRRCGWKTVAPEMSTTGSSPITKEALSKKNRRDQGTLRVRVQRPADAAAALRHHNADEGIAELPWMPNTK